MGHVGCKGEGEKKPVKKENKNLQESRPSQQLLAGTDLLPWQGQIYFPGPFPALKKLAGPGGECFPRDLLGNSCCNTTKKG